MPSWIWNIIAVFVGVFVGGIVNMILVSVGPAIVPLPEGADVSDMEKLAASMPLMQPINFLFPFLGHAVGTLAGAVIAARLAASWKMGLAMFIGFFFLAGGIAAINMLGGPMWFNVVDLVFAYLPMGYLGGLLGSPRAKVAAEPAAP